MVLLCCAIVAAQAPNASDAISLQQQGRLADAETAWRTVWRRSKDAAAFASLGVVLSREQKYSEAETAYKKALALDPTLPGIQLNLGLAEFKLGRFAAAIPPLKAALAQDPSNSQARACLE